MALTKPQKRFILDNYKILNIKEIGERLGIKETEIAIYLKQNNKKPLTSVSLVNKKETLLKEEKKNTSILEIIKENWKFLVLLCIGIVVLYANSLHGDFVSDDYATISQNPLIKDFSSGFKGFNGVYISAYLIAVLFGVNPVPYHLFSVILYLICVVTAFVLLNMLFDKKISMLSLVLFAVSPVHVEAVSWISGRIYLFLALYVMLGTIFFIKFLEDEKYINLFWVFVFFVLGFLTDKPRPFSLFLIIALCLVFKKVDLKKIKIFNYWPVALIILFMSVLFAWPTIVSRVTTVNSGYNGSGSIFYSPAFQYPTAVTKYLQLLFVPTDLTLYHTMYVIPVWLNWLILLSYLAATVYFYFKDKRFFFALAFIFLANAPSMAPIKVSWLVAERYVFLGSLGFCLFLALSIERLGKKYIYLATVLFALLVSFYSIRTFLRNVDWRTNHNLWVNTVQVSPNSHNAWNNIGDDYDKLKQYDNAIKGFTQSTVAKADYADAFHNRANILFKVGRLDLARDSYMTALKFAPGLYQTYFSLTQIDLMEKQYMQAVQDAQAAVKLQPNSFQAHYVLGVVYSQIGNLDGAVKELNYTVQLNPGFKPAEDLIKNIQASVSQNKK